MGHTFKNGSFSLNCRCSKIFLPNGMKLGRLNLHPMGSMSCGNHVTSSRDQRLRKKNWHQKIHYFAGKMGTLYLWALENSMTHLKTTWLKLSICAGQLGKTTVFCQFKCQLLWSFYIAKRKNIEDLIFHEYRPLKTTLWSSKVLP